MFWAEYLNSVLSRWIGCDAYCQTIVWGSYTDDKGEKHISFARMHSSNCPVIKEALTNETQAFSNSETAATKKTKNYRRKNRRAEQT